MGGTQTPLETAPRDVSPGWPKARFISCCIRLSKLNGLSSKKPSGSSKRDGTEGRKSLRIREVCRPPGSVLEIDCEVDGWFPFCADITYLHVNYFDNRPRKPSAQADVESKQVHPENYRGIKYFCLL
jgi:hypothetical protein